MRLAFDGGCYNLLSKRVSKKEPNKISSVIIVRTFKKYPYSLDGVLKRSWTVLFKNQKYLNHIIYKIAEKNYIFQVLVNISLKIPFSDVLLGPGKVIGLENDHLICS